MSEPRDPSEPREQAEQGEPREQGESGRPEKPGESGWARKRRLARVFGDVLPESTRDDRDEVSQGGEGVDDRWLRDQVPPHHGS